MRKFWGILHLPPEHLHILQASASVHTLHSICVYTVVLFLTFHIPFYRLSWHKVKCMKKYSFPNDQSIKLIFCDFWFVFSFSAQMISLIIIINNRSKCPIHLKSQTEKKILYVNAVKPKSLQINWHYSYMYNISTYISISMMTYS